MLLLTAVTAYAGRSLTIYTVDGESYEKCLIESYSSDSLHFRSTALDIVLPIGDIQAMRLNSKPYTLGLILGGAAIGYFIAGLEDYESEDPTEQFILLITAAEYKVKFILTTLGAGLGGLVSLVRYGGLYIRFSEFDVEKQQETLQWLSQDYGLMNMDVSGSTP